jgi:hypothetical protein
LGRMTRIFVVALLCTCSGRGLGQVRVFLVILVLVARRRGRILERTTRIFVVTVLGTCSGRGDLGRRVARRRHGTKECEQLISRNRDGSTRFQADRSRRGPLVRSSCILLSPRVPWWWLSLVSSLLLLLLLLWRSVFLFFFFLQSIIASGIKLIGHEFHPTTGRGLERLTSSLQDKRIGSVRRCWCCWLGSRRIAQ